MQMGGGEGRQKGKKVIGVPTARTRGRENWGEGKKGRSQDNLMTI